MLWITCGVPLGLMKYWQPIRLQLSKSWHLWLEMYTKLITSGCRSDVSDTVYQIIPGLLYNLYRILCHRHPIQGVFPLCAQCSKDRLRIHRDPDATFVGMYGHYKHKGHVVRWCFSLSPKNHQQISFCLQYSKREFKISGARPWQETDQFCTQSG